MLEINRGIFVLNGEQLTLGKVLNKGPIHRMTIKSKPLVKIPLTCVLPPISSMITVLDRPTQPGNPLKNDVNKFPTPCVKSSWK